MTTKTITIMPNGDQKEVFTNPGAAPIVFINGVLQTPKKTNNVPWKPWFAWRPVKDIHGFWHWWENIYRKRGNTYVDQDDWSWYYYGTILDVLKDE